jgi:type IV secretion system protein VirB5
MKKIMMTFLMIFSFDAAAQATPVFDASNWTYQLEQIDHMKNQIDQLKSQLNQAKQQYEAMTGTRNLGSILNNPELKQTLPTQWQTVYSTGRSANYDISGSIANIIKEEKYNGSIDSMQKSIQERSQKSAATDKAIGLKAYEDAEKRLSQIESLMQKIDTTKDPKGIEELQARIAIEQTMIQNETTKLQMISQLQQAEKQLIQEQKNEMNRRILNKDNKGMPTIK